MIEYIQCPHCRKKYSINDKVRAASGRNINCKVCEKPFKIVVLSVEEGLVEKEREESASQSTLPHPQRDHKTARKKEQTKKPHQSNKKKRKVSAKLHKALAMSLLLLLLLILLSIGGFLLYQKPHILESWQTQMSATPETPPEEEPTPEKAQTQPESTEEARQEIPFSLSIEEIDAGPRLASKACVEAAASQWFIDYTLMHSHFSTDDYIGMLDESSRFSEAIIQECKDSMLVAVIVHMAKKGRMPQWLKREIQHHISDSEASDIMVK